MTGNDQVIKNNINESDYLLKTPKVDKVVGLKYGPNLGLPEVIVKGQGALADEIINKGNKIKGRPFVIQDEELVEKLYSLPIGSNIQPELFELVAAVLVHVYSVEEKLREK